jgi:hypothetical protein
MVGASQHAPITETELDMTSTVTTQQTCETGLALDTLAAALPGRVHLPTDADWDAHRLAWMRSVDQQPVAVVEAATAEDVVAAVRVAAGAGLAVGAQPVGHGATTALTGTVLVRTRGLQQISVDVENRLARVGAGVKWGEALEALAPHGLVGLAGSSGDPTVVGFSVSGGLSWFGRAYGLAAHSIRAVELVDATATLRRVTAESDPELFWAVCGGGGDFGIVTALEFEVYPAPHVYGGRLMWPIELAYPVFKAFQRITADAPDELTLWAHLLRFPPMPELPEFLRGKSFVSIDSTFLGPAEDAEALLAPLREIPAMYLDTMGTVPVDQLGAICAEPTDPMPATEWSELLADFDDDALDRLLGEAGHQAQTPLMVVQVRHLGGALARGTAGQGPSGAVHEPYQLFALGVPITPELGAALDLALGGLQLAMDGHTSGRTSFTFCGANADASRAFTPAALARLQRIKRTVDPTGTIRSNRPVLGS